MSQFITELDIRLKDENIWVLEKPLLYYSSLLDRAIAVPEGFENDLASVPRLPFIFWFWGGRTHREAVIHDYLYRIDSKPVVSFWMANRIFLEAAKLRGKPRYIRWPMYWGVCLGGYPHYHKRFVGDKL